MAAHTSLAAKQNEGQFSAALGRVDWLCQPWLLNPLVILLRLAQRSARAAPLCCVLGHVYMCVLLVAAGQCQDAGVLGLSL